MKNLVFVFVAILTIGFMSSCNKDNDVSTNDLLIEEISNNVYNNTNTFTICNNS